MPNTGYDDSGQVFTETSCRAGPMTSEWEWKTHGSIREQANYHSPGPGCSSLSAMATRSFLHNSPNLTPSSLDGLPWKLASALWAQLRRSKLDSVRVWKCFATTQAPILLHPSPASPPSPSSPPPIKKLKIINHPNVPLNLYIAPLLSPDCKWLTILTLQAIHCTRSDLISLTRLTNLACLTMGEDLVCDAGPGMDDAIVRAWSDHAAADANTNAWAMLRVLSFRLQPLITVRSFRYLAALPMLAVVNVSECGVSAEQVKEARGLGWRCHDSRDDAGVEKQMTSAAAERRFVWDEMAERGLALALARSVEGDGAGRVKMEALDVGLPRLHLALGRSYIGPGEGRDGFIVGKKKMTFVRSSLPSGEAGKEAVANRKRKCNEGGLPAKSLPRKRPTLRLDHQQDLSNSFLEFVK